MHDAFISYAREDLAIAGRLHDALTTAGKDVWRDLKGIAAGEVYWNEIEEAIAGSHYFLFLMSPESLNSENCRRELDFAVRCDKRILPIEFREVAGEHVWEPLRGVQWIYAAGRPDAAAAELVEALDGIPQYRRLHTRWLERARDWAERARDQGALLRGAELANAEEWLEYSTGRSPAPNELQREFISASRTGEDSTKDRILGQRLANQADGLLSEGASVLERSMLIAIESMRRLPTSTAHRVLSQGLERLPSQLPSLSITEVYAIDAFGRLVASLDPNATTIVVTDLTGKIEQRRLESTPSVRALELARQGSYLLVWHQDDTITVVEVATGKELLRSGSSPVRAAHFSHDGLHFAALDESGRLLVSEVGGQGLLAEVTREAWIEAKLMAFQGELAAIQRSDDAVSIWSVGDQREIALLTPGELEKMALSPDGRRLLTIPPRGDQPALWSIDNQECISTFSAHNWGLGAVSFCPVTGHLASASSDRTARIWDANGVSIAILEHETEVFDAVWAADGSHLATRERNGAARVWDTLGRDRGSSPADDEWRTVLGLGIDGTTKTVVTKADSALERWRFGTPSGPPALVDQANPLLTSIAFSSDGRYLAALYDYRRLIVHEIATGEVLGTFESDEGDDSYFISASPDPRYLLVHGGATFLVELPRFSVRRLPMSGIQEELAWSRTGDVFAGAGPKIWSMPAGEEILGLDQNTWGLAISPDGLLVATTGPDELPQVIVAGDARQRQPLGQERNAQSCSFSPDGKRVATGGADGTARIWDTATGEELALFNHGPEVKVRSVDFSPDGTALATAGADATARVWNIESGTESFRGLHHGEVTVVRFDPSGRYLGSGGQDQTARVWDFTTNQEIARFRHEELVYGLKFSPDGKYLTTLSAYGTRRVGRIWLWHPAELIEQVKSRLTRDLTAEERRYFLGAPP